MPQTATTPDQPPINEPVTPAKNPASIDRRGLVGVGELATPRWTRSERIGEVDDAGKMSPFSAVEVVVSEHSPDDKRGSPWTIEAVEEDVSSTPCSFPWLIFSLQLPLELPKTLRNRPSVAEESGGEEILYPRNPSSGASQSNSKFRKGHKASLSDYIVSNQDHSIYDGLPALPPSSFTPARRAKKRTSDEFEMDQHGSLVSKRSGTGSTSSDIGKGEKTISTASARKHRSLNAGTSSMSPRDGRPRDRRRESLGISLSGVSKLISSAKSSERHSRQISAGSTTSSVVDGRRAQATDFSHLPPSPASSSIQHLLKQSASNKSHTPPPSSGVAKDNSQSPNVAHSLLRGTQEGWSALDDEATAEALRKLDGLTGKSARARASVGSFGRASSSSRPVTPAKVGSQWEGIASDLGKSKRGSGSEKEGKETLSKHSSFPGPVDADESEGLLDDQLQSLPIPEKTPKKVGARMSFTPKRGSTSSTYASTPTTSSRDSASVSTGTSLTSVSGTSGRHSSGKARRNSAGSDISSSEANLLKDRVASIAIIGDASDGGAVPPVPPLPKDFSSYRSPPPTSSSLSFPSLSGSEDSGKRPSHDFNFDRTSSLEVHSYMHQSHIQRQGHQHGPGPLVPEPTPLAPKTPSKKWSFSNALNLRLSSSPSSNSKSSFPLSPRAVSFGQQLRKSTSKEKGSSKVPWTPEQPDAMTSAGSLASLSSMGSVHASGITTAHNAKTPDRGVSRSGTGSSASTNNTASAIPAAADPLSPSSSVRRTQSKRLTPSSIPFFRRSSSQSMQVPPAMPPSASPPGHLATPRSKLNASPSRDFAALSTSVPGSASKKSSVLSLGLPSLLKSSSRRSLHSDAKDSSSKEGVKTDKEVEKMRLRGEKERKKEEKERSESRISLMIRKRGKVSLFSSRVCEQPSIDMSRLCRQRILESQGLL